jgi:hypothetical protein
LTDKLITYFGVTHSEIKKRTNETVINSKNSKSAKSWPHEKGSASEMRGKKYQKAGI